MQTANYFPNYCVETRAQASACDYTCMHIIRLKINLEKEKHTYFQNQKYVKSVIDTSATRRATYSLARTSTSKMSPSRGIPVNHNLLQKR